MQPGKLLDDVVSFTSDNTQERMTQTFSHGDRVTCTIASNEITDARISIDGDGMQYICHNEEGAKGCSSNNKFGYKHSWPLREDFTSVNVKNLRLATPKEKTWNNLEVGDKLASGNLTKTIVDWGVNKMAFAVDTNGLTSVWSMDELVSAGYHIVQPTPAPVEKRWYVTTLLGVGYKGKNSSVMKRRAEVGNAFATREEAEEAARKMRIATTK